MTPDEIMERISGLRLGEVRCLQVHIDVDGEPLLITIPTTNPFAARVTPSDIFMGGGDPSDRYASQDGSIRLQAITNRVTARIYDALEQPLVRPAYEHS
jgi:hypothetical protein